jgi:hypothetical protein
MGTTTTGSPLFPGGSPVQERGRWSGTVLRRSLLSIAAVVIGVAYGIAFKSSLIGSTAMIGCILGLWGTKKELRPIPEILFMIVFGLGLAGVVLLLEKWGLVRH